MLPVVLIAAVAAETEAIAREAVSLIEVEYEDLPVVLTPEEALAEGRIYLLEIDVQGALQIRGQEFDGLFKAIATLAPAPYGAGPEWKRGS